MEKKIQTKEDFQRFVEGFQKKYKMPYAYALGQAFHDENSEISTVRWLNVNIEQNMGFYSACMSLQINKGIQSIKTLSLNQTADRILDRRFSPFEGEQGHKNIDILKTSYANSIVMIVYPTKEMLTEAAPVSAEDVMCRLTMLSLLKFKPNELNLDSAFGLLKRLYYTSNGALTENQWQQEFMNGNCITPISVDKFPPMHWGAPLPEGVRIADPSRVRLGAYLSPGTTVMHEGFVNFNAGTLGKCMVEGRISAGVTVSANSDIGGGASIMGMLSGGGKERISIGSNCLLGANAGTGISLGDRCTIEAGLYVKFGMPVKICSDKFELKDTYTIKHEKGTWIKSQHLSGLKDMLLLRSSVTGVVELRFNEKPVNLNANLH